MTRLRPDYVRLLAKIPPAPLLGKGGSRFPCQDEKSLLSEQKPRGAWNLSRSSRMETS
jgi:hypothetical protein